MREPKHRAAPQAIGVAPARRRAHALAHDMRLEAVQPRTLKGCELPAAGARAQKVRSVGWPQFVGQLHSPNSQVSGFRQFTDSADLAGVRAMRAPCAG
eukprot:5808908-Prymnesium_polylepis.1